MLESVRHDIIQERSFEEAIRRFGEIVVQDKVVQGKLNGSIDKGESRAQWVALYAALAKEKGFSFTAEQMLVAMQEQKQGKDKIIPSMVQKMISLL
jgi:hypothetical protein